MSLETDADRAMFTDPDFSFGTAATITMATGGAVSVNVVRVTDPIVNEMGGQFGVSQKVAQFHTETDAISTLAEDDTVTVGSDTYKVVYFQVDDFGMTHIFAEKQ